MASPEYEQLRKVLKPGLAIPTDPPEVVREKMHRIHPTKYPGDVRVERTMLGGVDAAWVGTPESAGSTRVPLRVLSRPQRNSTPMCWCARTAPRSPAARSWG